MNLLDQVGLQLAKEWCCVASSIREVDQRRRWVWGQGVVDSENVKLLNQLEDQRRNWPYERWRARIQGKRWCSFSLLAGGLAGEEKMRCNLDGYFEWSLVRPLGAAAVAWADAWQQTTFVQPLRGERQRGEQNVVCCRGASIQRAVECRVSSWKSRGQGWEAKVWARCWVQLPQCHVSHQAWPRKGEDSRGKQPANGEVDPWVRWPMERQGLRRWGGPQTNRGASPNAKMEKAGTHGVPKMMCARPKIVSNPGLFLKCFPQRGPTQRCNPQPAATS
jgi:hypothetical protein